jgi:hypothetical protein
MKQAKYNEIDVLLRGLAKGAKSGKSSLVAHDHGAEEQTLAEHMDADELSSYAERALPAGALARYTAHLSNCPNCRQRVTELALASGISVREAPTETITDVGFWQKLSVFFSPQVLRYAVPALALFAIIGVGLIALREKPQTEFVAQNQPSPSTAAPLAAGSVDSPPPITKELDAVTSTDKAGESHPSASAPAEKKPLATTDQVSQTAGKDESKSDVVKDLPSTKPSGAAEMQPSFAPEPAGPPPPKPQSSASTVATRNEEVAKEKQEGEKQPGAESRDAKNRPADDERARRETGVAGGIMGQSKAAPSNGRRGQANNEVRVTELAAKKREDKDKPEIRTVAGKHFRREGNAWVDSAFDSSRAATAISRGSEQYRALVADEPGIRTIAEQLPGEVVLVWKGRAYRIR